MNISTHPTDRSYLAPSNLPKLIETLESNALQVYDDGEHYATIGIGFNITEKGNPDCLKSVLDYLGVYAADDAAQEALRAAAHHPPRTLSEVRRRHKDVEKSFQDVIASHPLTRGQHDPQKPGFHPSEIALQQALTAKLATFGIQKTFAFASPTDSRTALARLISCEASRGCFLTS